MTKKNPTKWQSELGPIARTIAEIEREPRCAKCGRLNRCGDYECRK